MAQDIGEILAGAKKTLSEAESKFPSSQAPKSEPAPSYTQAHEARKSPAGIGEELREKAKMVQKARTALE